MHTTVCGMDSQQAPAVQHRDPYSIFRANLRGKKIRKTMAIRIWVTEALCGTAEINTMFHINYISITFKKNE